MAQVESNDEKKLEYKILLDWPFKVESGEEEVQPIVIEYDEEYYEDREDDHGRGEKEAEEDDDWYWEDEMVRAEEDDQWEYFVTGPEGG